MSELLTAAEMAERLRIKPTTLREWARKDLVKDKFPDFVKMGMISASRGGSPMRRTVWKPIRCMWKGR
jgi:hypothetical protein